MKIAVPIVKNVDILLIGGSLAGVKCAIETKKQGKSVFGITQYTYWGDDLCNHFDYQSPKSESFHYFFGEQKNITPMEIKLSLERKLIENNIDFFYQTYPVEPVVDEAGKIAGLLVANRSGFQIIGAKVIIDATEHFLAARACKIKCKDFVPGNYLVTQYVMGEPNHSSELTIKKLPEKMKVKDREYSVFKVSKMFYFSGNSASDFAKAECAMRHLSWSPHLVAASDLCRVELNDGVNDDYQPTTKIPIVIAKKSSPQEICHLVNNSIISMPKRFKPCKEYNQIDIIRMDSNFRFKKYPTIDYELNRIPTINSVDTLIIGGGTAGAAATIASALSGVKTLCIEALWEFGGICTAGRICTYWRGNRTGFTRSMDLGINAMGENSRFTIDSGKSEIEWKKEWLLREANQANAEIQFGSIAVAAALEKQKVCGVLCLGPYGIGVVKAKVVIDSTGNADVAAAAGAKTTYMSRMEIAIQGAGLPPVNPGDHTTNSDYQFICEHDVIDLTRTFVMGRDKFSEHFDLAQIADTRERRHIVGDIILQPQDFYCNRSYNDTITIARSNFDTHGFIVHPMFMLKPTEQALHSAKVPFRALLPFELEGIIVTGLGISAHRDCMPLVRMQPDVQNQGYAAGIAAAMAVKKNSSLRSLPIRELQKKLVDVAILPETILHEKDTTIGADTNDPHYELASIFMQPEQWLPTIKERYRKKPQINDAALLAFLGEHDGKELLEREIITQQWVNGWNYTGMGQFGASSTTLDVLIFALSKISDSPVFEQKLNELDYKQPFSHFRAICRAIMDHPGKQYIKPLEKLLSSPGICGWAQKNFNDVINSNRPEINDTEVRNSQLKEIYLAKALNKCAHDNPIANAILKDYQEGLQGIFAQYAND